VLKFDVLVHYGSLREPNRENLLPVKFKIAYGAKIFDPKSL